MLTTLLDFIRIINGLSVDETGVGGKRKYHSGALRKEPHRLFGIVDNINHKILIQLRVNR